MDIATFEKKLVASVNRRREGESYELFWLRQRECSPKRPIFWKIVIRTLRKFLIRVFSTSLDVCERMAIALSFSSKGIIADAFISIDTSHLKIELPRYEVSRDPPKRFVPIPDAEIGGCARNDSLIAPAI